MKKSFFIISMIFAFQLLQAQVIEKIHQGIWKITYGETFNFEKGDYNRIELKWSVNRGNFVRTGKQKRHLYHINKNWVKYP